MAVPIDPIGGNDHEWAAGGSYGAGHVQGDGSKAMAKRQWRKGNGERLR
jgi:hypothetical protein